MNDHPQSERSQLEHFAIADMLNLLSMFVAPTTRELAEGVSRGSVGRDVDAIFAHLGIGFDGTPSEGLTTLQGGSLAEENLFSEMRRSHTKLFSHPTQPLVSPYESSFVGMRDSPSTPPTPFLNESALHAEQCYKEAGLALSREKSREPGDHMAVELEFLAYLHMRVGAAMNAEDKSEIATWNAALAKFEPHIRCWGADFFATCERCAHDVTYRWLGKVGKTFLESIFAETD